MAIIGALTINIDGAEGARSSHQPPLGSGAQISVRISEQVRVKLAAEKLLPAMKAFAEFIASTALIGSH